MKVNIASVVVRLLTGMFERVVFMKNTNENTQMFEVVSVPADVLPCPFCGGVAKIVVLGEEDSVNVYGGVCTSCFSVGRPCITPMEAAFYWNKRVK